MNKEDVVDLYVKADSDLAGMFSKWEDQIKEKVGIENIETIERYWLEKFYSRFLKNKKIVFYGPTDIDKKVNIIPFNIKHKDRILHPKFVTKLMNDLFGIQTRAGCSCAGPYGHRLLDISDEISKYYQCLIGVDKYSGLKPGWIRFNLHYALSPEEYEYIVEVLDFIIENGHLFISFYEFDFRTGDWYHIENRITEMPIDLDIEELLNKERFELEYTKNVKEIFKKNLSEAKEIVKELKESDNFGKFEENLERLMFFYVVNFVGKDVVTCKLKIG